METEIQRDDTGETERGALMETVVDTDRQFYNQHVVINLCFRCSKYGSN